MHHTLIPLIQRHIRAGTIIVSDEWRAYNDLYYDPNYQRLTVNHSVNFVNPDDDRAHTQTIEGKWGNVKSKFRQMHGTSDSLFPTYLAEHFWRCAHKEMPFQNILFWIRHYYTV